MDIGKLSKLKKSIGNFQISEIESSPKYGSLRRYDLTYLNPLDIGDKNSKATSGVTPCASCVAFSFNAAYVELYNKICELIKERTYVQNIDSTKQYVSLMYETEAPFARRILAFSYIGDVENTAQLSEILARADRIVDVYEFCIFDTTNAGHQKTDIFSKVKVSADDWFSRYI